MNSTDVSYPTISSSKYIIPLSRFPVSPMLFHEIFQLAKSTSKYRLYHYGCYFPAAEVPQLRSLQKEFELEWDVLFFCLGKDQVGLPTHKDGCPTNPYSAAVNLPILNCDHRTETLFLRGPDHVPIYSKVGARFPISELEVVERHAFHNDDGFFLFSSGTWHKVRQHSDFSDERVMMSWRFKPGVSWNEALRRMQKFR
jgi:hypothetical protein